MSDMRAYVRSHPQIRVSTTEIPEEPNETSGRQTRRSAIIDLDAVMEVFIVQVVYENK